MGRGRRSPCWRTGISRRRCASSCRRPAAGRSPSRSRSEWSALPRLVFACGRYEGIDARVPQWVAAADRRWPRGRRRGVSIGDYVLAGGEAAVLVMVEAVTRLVPGSWATRPATPTTRSPRRDATCWRPRSTPGRRSGRAWRCPTCCSPATTARSPAGVASRPRRARRPMRPDLLGPDSIRPDAGSLIGGSSDAMVSGRAGHLWQTWRAGRAASPPQGRCRVVRTGTHPTNGVRATCGSRQEATMNKLDVVDSRLAALRHPRLPSRRHREGPREGRRGHPLPHPGLPGRRDPSPGRRAARDLHRPQDQLRRRRRAHLPAAHARSSTRSRSSPVATSAARSSTTCASCAARRRRSARSARAAERSRFLRRCTPDIAARAPAGWSGWEPSASPSPPSWPSSR